MDVFSLLPITFALFLEMTRRKRRPRVEEDQTFSTQKRQKKESIETKQIEKAEQDIEPDQTFKEGIYIPREVLPNKHHQ